MVGGVSECRTGVESETSSMVNRARVARTRRVNVCREESPEGQVERVWRLRK